MNEFLEYLKDNNIELGPKRLENLKTFFALLVEWNQKMNLTAIREETAIWHKHFLDSATVIPHIPEDAKHIIDIGTGAGFPGLVVAIINPELHVTLVDSVGKKVQFLQHVIQTLDLKNTEVLQVRAEDLAFQKEYREHFDVGLGRAVALLPTLLEYTLPFIKMGGIFIAQKQQGNEDMQSETALPLLGGELKEKVTLNLSTLSPRELIIIQKTNQTPKEYPRKEGLPKRRPL